MSKGNEFGWIDVFFVLPSGADFSQMIGWQPVQDNAEGNALAARVNASLLQNTQVFA